MVSSRSYDGFTERFANEERPGNSELDCICLYSKEQRSSFEAKWTAWPKGNLVGNLKALIKHKSMTEAFDGLLIILGR